MTDGQENIQQEQPVAAEQQAAPAQAQAPKRARRVSKAEKKFKKAMAKMGMKPFEGITRVTLKTNKNFILYIDNPEVMKNTAAESSYIIFGEAKFLDFTKTDAKSQLDKFKAAQSAIVKEDAEAEDAGDNEAEGDVDAGDIPEETISTLIEYTSCTRAKAIEALKQTGGDLVEAITLIN